MKPPAGESRAILELSAVGKAFGSLTAVDRIDLEIMEGEFFTMLGPSGSGKTTLVRILAGMESATAGNIWLRGALVEAALGATRTKNSAVGARYRRDLRHRGHKKAIIAVAHSLLVTAYHVLARRTTYQELGADYYDRRDTERVARRAVHTLEQQGYRVTLERVA